MPDFIDPVIAAVAAAILGASGPTIPASPPPTSCEQTTHTRAGEARHHPAADEVVEKIRAVVTEITARARSGTAIDAPAVADVLDRANLPATTDPECAPETDNAPHPRPHAPRTTPTPAGPAAADAATSLAIRIIDALTGAGFMTSPHTTATTPGHGDPADPEDDPAADDEASSDTGGSANGDGDGSKSDSSKSDSSASDGPDAGPSLPPGRAGDGPADAETVPLPRPAPLPRTDTDPARPPTSQPPTTPEPSTPEPTTPEPTTPEPTTPEPTTPEPTTPEPTTPEPTTAGSTAAAVEQLLGELAAALSTTNDPGLQQLVEDLHAVLDRGVTAPGHTGSPGQLPTTITDLLPESATALFHDDFETGDLARWGSCQGAGVNGDCASATAADGMGVAEDPERGLVAQFSVVDGKEAEMGGERSEVRDDNNPGTLVTEGDDRWYSWSMKFPADLPDPSGGWNIVMQWHQSADSGSPPLALDISQGSLDIGGDGADAPRQTIGPLRRGEWVDYVLHVGFSQSDGFVEAWENGVQTVSRTARQTMADEASYLKMGIYRDPEATGDAAVLFDDLIILGADGSSGAPGLPPGGDTTGDSSGDSSGGAENSDKTDRATGDGDDAGRDGGDASPAVPGGQPNSPPSGPPRPSPPADQAARPPAPTRAATPGGPPQPARPPVVEA